MEDKHRQMYCDKCPHCKRKNKLTHTCLRCQRSWKSSLQRPKQCTFCKSVYWDKVRNGNRGKHYKIKTFNVYFVTDIHGRHERDLFGRTIMRLSQIVCKCGNIYPRNPVELRQTCPLCMKFGMTRYANKVLNKQEFLSLVKAKVEGKLTYRVGRMVDDGAAFNSQGESEAHPNV